MLSDFGLAVEKDATHFTFAAGGTLPYMAPEQLRGRAEPASDIFALGVILYQLCTGRLPFKRSLVDLRNRAPIKPLIRPSELFELLPPDLDDVILRALTEDPRQRYVDALDFWDAVQEVISASTLHAISRQQSLHPPRQSSLSHPSLPSATPDGATRKPPTAANSIWSSPNLPGDMDDLAPDAIAYIDASEYELDSEAAHPPHQESDAAAYPSMPPRRNSDYKNTGTPARSSLRTSRGLNTSPGHAVPPANTGRAAVPPTRVLPPEAYSSSGQKAARSGGTGQSIPTRPRRPGRKLTIGLLVSALLILGLLLVLLTPIFPGLHTLTGMSAIFPGTANNPSGPTITIVPSSKTVTDNYVLQAVTTNPDPQQLQVSLHNLTATPTTQTRQITGTGHTQTNGTVSKGILTFLNGSFNPFTISVATTIPGPNGTEFLTDGPITIPAANTNTNRDGQATISAHATKVGTIGNIQALNINQTCCTTGNFVVVQNTSAFTGGQDPADYKFVQQEDVDAVVNPLVKTLTQQAQGDINGQLAANEKLIGNPDCTKNITSNKGEIGDQGHNVTSTSVTVSATCTAMAYDQKGAQQVAQDRLQRMAARDPGTGYARVGNITSQVVSVNRQSQNITLLVSAQGTWAYQFSPQSQRQLLQSVAGKSVGAAEALLKQQNGIANVFIHIKGGDTATLPTNPASINIQIQDIQVPKSANG
ncbi:serine/threonine protein kinase [Dictyobacter kobayashii]|uniref:serine/threonine protein kinase n=1 Tax=Dictyobacter kobayashii TaxID=2014872 RepID=UPI0035307759